MRDRVRRMRQGARVSIGALSASSSCANHQPSITTGPPGPGRARLCPHNHQRLIVCADHQVRQRREAILQVGVGRADHASHQSVLQSVVSFGMRLAGPTAGAHTHWCCSPSWAHAALRPGHHKRCRHARPRTSSHRRCTLVAAARKPASTSATRACDAGERCRALSAHGARFLGRTRAPHARTSQNPVPASWRHRPPVRQPCTAPARSTHLEVLRVGCER